jgi:hypothetical protein
MLKQQPNEMHILTFSRSVKPNVLCPNSSVQLERSNPFRKNADPLEYAQNKERIRL